MQVIKASGGNAFPTDNYYGGGMSLRDWFAGQALAGILTRAWGEAAVKDAYEHADWMIAEREKQK